MAAAEPSAGLATPDGQPGGHGQPTTVGLPPRAGWADQAGQPPQSGDVGRAGQPLRVGEVAHAGRAWLWTCFVLTAGALAVAVLLAPPASASPGRGLAWLLFTGSSAHVAATGWLFTLPSVRAYARQHRVRCCWVPVGLVIVAAITAAIIPAAAFRWLLLPYFSWQFIHYCKQNIGMVALAASSHRVPPLSKSERWPLLLAGCAAVARLVAEPRLLGLRVDPGLAGTFPLAATVFAIAVAAGLGTLARRAAADRPPGFCVVYLTSLLFSLPVFVFASPYAAVGGMTVAHGFQYLLLVGLIAGAGPAGMPRLARLAVAGNIALIGGAALSAASHLHNADPAGRLIFGGYLGVVMAHFVIDAGLWRMRDPLARQFLANYLSYLMPARVAPARSQTVGAAGPASAP